MTQRKLLIDADLLCHMQTAAAEHPFRWESDLWTLHSDPNEAMASTTQHIERLMKDLEADSVELAWNDLEGGNFRRISTRSTRVIGQTLASRWHSKRSAIG